MLTNDTLPDLTDSDRKMYDQIVRVIAVIGAMLALSAIVINLSMFVFTKKLKRAKRLTLSIGGLIMLSSFCEALLNLDVLNTQILDIIQYGPVAKFIDCYTLTFPQFVTVPLGKATLLFLSIDRLYAMTKPMKYKGRNHDRSAIMATVITFSHSFLWLAVAFTQKVSGECWEVHEWFDQLLLLWTLLLDFVTYGINIAIVMKSRRANAITSNDQELMNQKKRQAKTTATIVRAVAMRFCFSTIPIILTIAVFAFDTPNHVLRIVFPSVGICLSLETILNTIMYVTQLPDYSNAVKKMVSTTRVSVKNIATTKR